MASVRNYVCVVQSLNEVRIHSYVSSLSLGDEIEWARLRDFLRLAQKAASSYNPSKDDSDDKQSVSRQTIELFFRFMTSKTGLFLKKPLVHELAEAIDGMASIGEANLLRFTRGFLPPLPGMNGPVNNKRMEELQLVLEAMLAEISSVAQMVAVEVLEIRGTRAMRDMLRLEPA